VDRIRELIDKATEESDEPYNDSLDAYEAGEEKVASLSAIILVLWKHMNETQRGLAVNEIDKGH